MSSLVNHTVDGDNVLAASAAAAAPNGEQKRPNSNDAECEPEGKKRRVEEDAKPPAAERCYICFDLRNEEGELPVRDCSCRGGAGYAHKSCIVQYAKMNHDDRGEDYVELWRNCPQCKQEYQNDLAVDLANEAVSFVEGRAPASREWHLCEQLEALQFKLSVIKSQLPLEDRTMEVESTANKIFPIVEEIKAFTNSSHLDETIYSAELAALMSLGRQSLEGDSAQAAVGYFEKCRTLSKEMGEEDTAAVFEPLIDAAKQMAEGKTNILTIDEEQAKEFYRQYEEEREKKGEDDAYVIGIGLNIGEMHRRMYKIKAERLLTKVLASSRRVHGADHGVTRKVNSTLQKCKERYVSVKCGGEQKEYQALRYQYEEGGAKCIVQGPVEEPRDVEGEEKLTIPTGDLWFLEGTPVICQCSGGYSTRSSREIDGKIGAVRSWDDKRGCYEVRFEDEDLGTRWVKRESVRILFELPSGEADP